MLHTETEYCSESYKNQEASSNSKHECNCLPSWCVDFIKALVLIASYTNQCLVGALSEAGERRYSAWSCWDLQPVREIDSKRAGEGTDNWDHSPDVSWPGIPRTATRHSTHTHTLETGDSVEKTRWDRYMRRLIMLQSLFVYSNLENALKSLGNCLFLDTRKSILHKLTYCV